MPLNNWIVPGSATGKQKCNLSYFYIFFQLTSWTMCLIRSRQSVCESAGTARPPPALVDLRAATDRAPCRYSFDVALTSDHDVINHINRGLMPMTHSPKVGANNRYQKTDTGFWRVWHAIWYRIFLVYQFLVTCCIFAPVYGTDFLVRVASADFWSVCHGHKGKIFQLEWCLLGGQRFLHGSVCLLAMQFFSPAVLSVIV